MQANVNKHPVPPPVVARLTVIKQQYMHSQIEDSSEPDDEIAQLVPNVKTNILDNLLCDDSEEEDSEHVRVVVVKLTCSHFLLLTKTVFIICACALTRSCI